ncbi:MAG: hypothetical protein EBU84_21095 [Actinobacteria bacterium]|nr:hypothetical protein [Actinomycetota bacterium]
MRPNTDDRIRLRACSAVLTLNRSELEWANSQTSDVLGMEIKAAIREALTIAPVPGRSRLVRATTYLPPRAQYLGQRAVLLFPRLAHRILRSTGLHHQLY